MKTLRFTEEQIVFALKRPNWGRPCRTSAAGWASLVSIFTPDVRNTAGFRLQKALLNNSDLGQASL